MAGFPYFKFYASDWLGSTKRAIMTQEQRAAYIDLLSHQWGDETCSLPDDDEVLAALSGLGQGWFKGGSEMLRRCFPKHPTLEGRIANPKLLDIRADAVAWSEKSAEGGRKSAESKKLKAAKGGSTTLPTKRQRRVARLQAAARAGVQRPRNANRQATKGGPFSGHPGNFRGRGQPLYRSQLCRLLPRGNLWKIQARCRGPTWSHPLRMPGSGPRVTSR